MDASHKQLYDRLHRLPGGAVRLFLSHFMQPDEIEKAFVDDVDLDQLIGQQLDGQQRGQLIHELYRLEVLCNLIGVSNVTWEDQQDAATASDEAGMKLSDLPSS